MVKYFEKLNGGEEAIPGIVDSLVFTFERMSSDKLLVPLLLEV